MMHRETHRRASQQHNAHPNAKRVPMLKPSCGTRCRMRATAIAKPPRTHCLQHAACGKRKPAPFRPRSRHLGAEAYPLRGKRTVHFARPGFVCGARIARFVHLWPKRAILARLRATWWTFSTIFCSWRAISSKHRTFMAYIPRRIVHLVQRRPKSNDSSQLTKENARFGHDRLKRASFALCIAAHLGSYRSSSLNGAVEA